MRFTKSCGSRERTTARHKGRARDDRFLFRLNFVQLLTFMTARRRKAQTEVARHCHDRRRTFVRPHTPYGGPGAERVASMRPGSVSA